MSHEMQVTTLIDRRRSQRYGIQLDLRWKLLRRKVVVDEGTGWTLDLSSSGLHFECGRTFQSGELLEVSIDWPVLLHDVTPLQFVICGVTVRSSESRTGVRIRQAAFRTRRIAKRVAISFAAGMRG